MSGGHDVPAGWEHGRPVIPPDPAAGACADCAGCPVCVRMVAAQGCCCDRPRVQLPEEFLTSRRGVRVGNVLETDGAPDDDEWWTQ
ncbi:hypothetical protein [Actinomadura violacea]|uniref:Uncharacterized protein n=1 Tax=Actinomadura violacea TaxID=2819934 RepID=A0ABS3RRI6_9ACTN|nr:hypothetical protein [Actinomadura violacea]MBO2459359.1 hypothetical protein [Actinomadura violacea]